MFQYPKMSAYFLELALQTFWAQGLYTYCEVAEISDDCHSLDGRFPYRD